MGIGQEVVAGVGHGGIIGVLQTQFSSFVKPFYFNCKISVSKQSRPRSNASFRGV